ncbi:MULTISPECIES: hypothetical protein [unclassified Mesorhizobium]|nr:MULTISPECIES: hypothetical protein [unclassified Mesorhizobium]
MSRAIARPGSGVMFPAGLLLGPVTLAKDVVDLAAFDLAASGSMDR